jgi:protein-tyrosine-phosphatase
MKRVHFICRGNSFRSRLAEAYLKSLNLKGITVLSSGTVAADHAAINGPLLNCTRHVLGLHHILKYDKGHWEQLTASRLSGNDITIFMGQLS